MKKSVISAAVIFVSLPFAAFAATYKVDADRSGGVYRCGERASFTVRLLSTGNLAAAARPYARLDNFGPSVLTNLAFDVTKTGVAFTVLGTLHKP